MLKLHLELSHVIGSFMQLVPDHSGRNGTATYKCVRLSSPHPHAVTKPRVRPLSSLCGHGRSTPHHHPALLHHPNPSAPTRLPAFPQWRPLPPQPRPPPSSTAVSPRHQQQPPPRVATWFPSTRATGATSGSPAAPPMCPGPSHRRLQRPEGAAAGYRWCRWRRSRGESAV